MDADGYRYAMGVLGVSIMSKLYEIEFMHGLPQYRLPPDNSKPKLLGNVISNIIIHVIVFADMWKRGTLGVTPQITTTRVFS